MTKDILVKTNNPEALDNALQFGFEAALVQDTSGNYIQEDGAYVVRCFGDAEFVAFALKVQGYAEVLSIRDA